MSAYFDLKEFRSYMIKTKNGKYHFKKGEPLKVENQEDIDRFRNETPLIEVDKNGNPVIENNNSTIISREYRRFRQANLQIPDDPENLLRKVYEEAARERETKGVDVSKLLEEVNKDALNKEVEPEVTPQPNAELIKEEKAVKDKRIQEATTQKKKKKKATECELCGRNFRSKAELEKHLADHEEEE